MNVPSFPQIPCREVSYHCFDLECADWGESFYSWRQTRRSDSYMFVVACDGAWVLFCTKRRETGAIHSQGTSMAHEIDSGTLKMGKE